jgi:hypothetical protein
MHASPVPFQVHGSTVHGSAVHGSAVEMMFMPFYKVNRETETVTLLCFSNREP